jgi:hypothetical protein
MFFLKLPAVNQIMLPLYVGITDRSFEARFAEHNEFLSTFSNWKRKAVEKDSQEFFNNGEIVFMAVPSDIIIATFFERVFLKSYDFPVNKALNTNRRIELHNPFLPSDSFEEGLERFEKVYYNEINQIKASKNNNNPQYKIYEKFGKDIVLDEVGKFILKKGIKSLRTG